MDEAKLKEWKSLADAAPEGPWGFTYDGSSGWSVGAEPDPQSNPICLVNDRDDERARAKASFLAAARAAVPALVAEVARLQAVETRASNEVADWIRRFNETQAKALIFEDEADRLGGEVKRLKEGQAMWNRERTRVGEVATEVRRWRAKERERCAEVAEILKMRSGDDGQEAMAGEIADAIRALHDEP